MRAKRAENLLPKNLTPVFLGCGRGSEHLRKGGVSLIGGRGSRNIALMALFGYGESEYEVSFGPAFRNAELSPSNPETPEPFNSLFRAQNPERSSDSNSPQKLGLVGQNLGSRGNIYPAIKGQWLHDCLTCKISICGGERCTISVMRGKLTHA